MKSLARLCGDGEFYNRRLDSIPGAPVKFFLDIWYLFAAAAVSGGLLLWPLLNKGGSSDSRVSTTDAVQLINRERAVLIDVSEPQEFAAGHAAGSKSVPFATIETATNLPKNKTLPLVVVCRTGARAGRAVATLRKLGFQNARSLAGGLESWRAANLPIEKTA